MPRSTVVLEKCSPKTDDQNVSAQVAQMLGKLPDIDQRLCRAKRIFIKLNLGIRNCGMYRNRPIEYTDPAVFRGLAMFLRGRTDAQVLVGDGTDFMTPHEAACARGHMAIIQEMGYQLVDLNQPPYARFDTPRPVMFRWYELSAALRDVDLWISVAKMKSHGLAGVTLTLKNMFGLTPNQVYASPRFALHSAIRLPRVLVDLAQIYGSAIGLIDGIIGGNYAEWGCDPVSSGVLIAGDNLVATDAVGARFMGVDPHATFGTPPFIRTDNHIKLASETGLGPLDGPEIDLLGDMPSERKPFSVAGGAEPEICSEMASQRREVGKLAQWYFGDRERFAQEYLDKLIILANGRVIFNDDVRPTALQDVVQALEKEKVWIYGVFAKLVRAEEAELSEPYGL